jgi:hypothetical protein
MFVFIAFKQDPIKTREDERAFLDELSAIKEEGIEKIAGKNREYAPLGYHETDWVDLTPQVSVVMSLLLPGAPTSLDTHRLPTLCDVRIVSKKKRTVALAIYYFGKWRLTYAEPTLHRCFIRTTPSVPLAHDVYSDEVITFCNLVDALARKNYGDTKRYSEELETAAGLRQ